MSSGGFPPEIFSRRRLFNTVSCWEFYIHSKGLVSSSVRNGMELKPCFPCQVPHVESFPVLYPQSTHHLVERRGCNICHISALRILCPALKIGLPRACLHDQALLRLRCAHCLHFGAVFVPLCFLIAVSKCLPAPGLSSCLPLVQN